MSAIKQFYLYIALFLLLPLVLPAQDFMADSLKQKGSLEGVKVVEPQVDSSNVQVRSFDQQLLDEFRNDPDYQYEKEPPPENSSLWDEFLNWMGELLKRIFFEEKSNSWMQILIYGLAGLAILYSVLKLLGVNVRGVFYGSSDSHRLQSELMEEDLLIRDFDKEIDQAVGEQRYREAVRLHYLQSLQKLSDASLIQWKIDKTNREYAFELRNQSLKKPFSKVTGIFENVYYGNFPVTQEVFEKASQDFQEFKSMIPKHATA